MAKAPHLYKKTPHLTKMAKGASTKALAFSPLLFISWDYYNSGSLMHTIMTTCRDFLWPIAAVAGKAMNFSPYQMLMTNVAGIAWTAWTIFGMEHDEPEENASEKSMILDTPEAMKVTRKRPGFLARKRQKWKQKRVLKSMTCRKPLRKLTNSLKTILRCQKLRFSARKRRRKWLTKAIVSWKIRRF